MQTQKINKNKKRLNNNINIFTSESVTDGHPDKICDQISDTILDEALRQDSNSRTGIEVLSSDNTLVIAGEINTSAKLEVEEISRNVLRDIGYNSCDLGIDYRTCKILNFLTIQSPDIVKGVVKQSDDYYESLGAGDQGMMFGFACRETKELMPLPIMLAHKITKKISLARKEKEISWLGPDGKSQVSVEYKNNKPYKVGAIVISVQHNEFVNLKTIKKELQEKILEVIVPKNFIKEDTKIFINPAGRFVKGGPAADAGLTGRKIIVDTYGGYIGHGGGAFSGKDPTKVDRSGAYMARYVAKNIVANGLAEKAEVRLAYIIGISSPVSLVVETFGTSHLKNHELINLINKNFNFRPAAIIKELNLNKPIYRNTATFGHFGRDDLNFPWEKFKKIK